MTIQRLFQVLAVLSVFLVAACASRNGSQTHETKNSEGSASVRPTDIRMDNEEVPEPVRAIETVIDRKGALVADDIEISVSRNYEWDIALTGNDVSPQRPDGEGHVSTAVGKARAMFRNLDIRAYKSIVFRKSGFGVVPFIQIRARGNALYVDATNDKPEVHRANAIVVQNAEIRFFGGSADGATVAGGRDFSDRNLEGRQPVVPVRAKDPAPAPRLVESLPKPAPARRGMSEIRPARSAPVPSRTAPSAVSAPGEEPVRFEPPIHQAKEEGRVLPPLESPRRAQPVGDVLPFRSGTPR